MSVTELDIISLIYTCSVKLLLQLNDVIAKINITIIFKYMTAIINVKFISW